MPDEPHQHPQPAPSRQDLRTGAIVGGTILLVIGVTALGLAYLAAFGMSWDVRPLAMTIFAALCGLGGAVMTVRAIVMIARAPRRS